MKVRVLGCSGAIAKDCRTTSFLVDGRILLDAGTGVGDLTLEEMGAVGDVLLTHSHLDHIAALPLMADAIGGKLTRPLRVHALAGTIAALKAHVFNDVIWPDFTRIPSAAQPFISLHEIRIGQALTIAGRQIEVLPAEHTVPAAGYGVQGDRGWFIFSGDTGPNPAFWRRINRLPVRALVIETAFSNRESDLADKSRHLSPSTLAHELDQIDTREPYPIHITHAKPAEADMIFEEIQAFDRAHGPRHDIQHLRAGQLLEV